MKRRQGTPEHVSRSRGYAAAILDLLPELGAGVFFAEVRHDPWCALLNGVGPCDCFPDIEVRRLGDQPAEGGK